MNGKNDISEAEQAAFLQLIDAASAAIFRMCKIYAVQPMDARDLFQEVVFQAWKSYATFRGQANAKTWLYRVALNVCLGTRSKLQRRNDETIKLAAIQFTVARQRPPEEEEKHRALQACIARLDPANRSLVILYLEDLPYREIADILGLTENHVAVKMKRIRAKLFDCITQKLAL